MYEIDIAGIDYVGLSNGILLAQNNKVILLDNVSSKVEFLNKKIFFIEDKEIREYL